MGHPVTSALAMHLQYCAKGCHLQKTPKRVLKVKKKKKLKGEKTGFRPKIVYKNKHRTIQNCSS